MEKLVDRIMNKIKFNTIKLENVCTKNYYNITRTDIIKDILKDNSLIILNSILPYVSYNEEIKQLYINCDDMGGNGCNRCEIYSSIKLDDFSRITGIELGQCGIIEEEEGKECISTYPQLSISFNKVNYNSYSTNVEVRGTFEGESDILYSLDYSDIGLEFYITGIKKNVSVPSWVEYMIEGLFNIQYNNYKMAFFNICAGFDNFINEIYDDIFDYYLEAYEQTKNDNVKIQIKDKIREFANKEKRLRNKLLKIFSELNINKKNGFEGLMSCFDKWDRKYIKTRDKIAHGGIYEEEYEIEDVAYTILTITFSILLNEDLYKNEWITLIES